MSGRVIRAATLALAAAALAACTRADAGESLRGLTESTVVSTGASNPTVALGPAGETTYVAWVGTGAGEPNVYLSRADGSGEFSAPVRVNDVAGDAAPHLQAPARVAVGPAGEVYVVWQNNTHVEGRRFPASDLRFARSADGGRTFKPAVNVNDDAGGPPTSHTFHDLAVAADGTIYVS